MKSLDKIFTEEQVNEVSDKILKSTAEKFKDELAVKFYNEMSGFLYDHYNNFSENLHKDLINEITEEFVNNPKDYKFLKLRQKLFNENKDELVNILTDEAIEKSVEDVIWQHMNKNYSFNWKWAETISKILIENYDKLKDNDGINTNLLHENNSLKSQIKYLQDKINILEYGE